MLGCEIDNFEKATPATSLGVVRGGQMEVRRTKEETKVSKPMRGHEGQCPGHGASGRAVSWAWGLRAPGLLSSLGGT